MKRPRSAAGEDILQGLFGTLLDLSDLSTDREKKAFTSSTLRLSTFEALEKFLLRFYIQFTLTADSTVSAFWASSVQC